MAKPPGREPRGKRSNLHILHPTPAARRRPPPSGAEHVVSADPRPRAPATTAKSGSRAAVRADLVQRYRAAARSDGALAQFRLGLLLILGDDVDRNYDEALSWLSLASAGGTPELSRECTPYILLLSVAIGPERTGEAVLSAWRLLLAEE